MQLSNRDDLERRGALRLSRLNARHHNELVGLLGNPPDVANVPDSFWSQVRQDVAAEVLLLILLVYSASAELHGLDSANAGILARGYADARAWQVADRFTGNAREAVDRYGADWHRRTAAPPVSPTEPPSPPQPSPSRPESAPGIPPSEVEAAADVVFGPANAERISIDETTAAQSAGGEDAIGRTVGKSEEDIWYTEGDRKVCPVCMPYHKTPRSVWSAAYPSGPGPDVHPRCRCWIQYARVNAGVEA